ncbi:response regulator [Sandaracinus amylolyticus]|uniref:response regulator n=1 Tax=Sandaracinus amylolyticus TaxID=927083 RepID=UPI001F001B4C|nr:response regulator [Sandaracinus amylolyticus]UJR80060.1 NO-binding membrane sensor protein with MHYT domain [Sandaracinus amylolyticus]
MSDRARPIIWVAEDVIIEAEAVRRTLSATYHVVLFSDGAGVLERAATGELPDLLVLDWHMPGVQGIEVCRFLRTQEATVGLPILVFTSTGDEQDMLEALTAGADDWVGKQASAAELLARVATLVRAKQLRDRAERAEREIATLLVREREARAEAEAANRAKDVFLAMVSHELRTPLNAILGWARLLRSGTLDPTRSERALDTIERNARAQARIVEDLLDLSRVIAGKLRLERATIDVADEVEQAIESLRPAAASKGVSLEQRVDRGMTIWGDAARVQQVAWNLVSNAIKFTPSGRRIEVTLSQDCNDICLRVRDEGIGIEPALVPHVFDRFRQADSTTTREQGGLGLGLAIVRQLTELHGGRVHAASGGPGQGATFEVHLPAHTTHERPEAIDVPAHTARHDARGLRLLVVDDDPDGLELLRVALERAGASVQTATSAAAALAALDASVPDLMVSDVSMPNLDGYGLMRAVRARLGARWVPAIALTAHARDEDRWEALAAGFQVHVPKPLDIDELISVIGRLVRRPDGQPER